MILSVIPCIVWFFVLLAFLQEILKFIFIDMWFIWVSILLIYIILLIFNKFDFWEIIREYFSSKNTPKKEATIRLSETLSQRISLTIPASKKSPKDKVVYCLNELETVTSVNDKILSNFFDNIFSLLDKSSFLISTKELPHNLANAGGASAKLARNGLFKSSSFFNPFEISWRSCKLYFYPHFIIYENLDSVEIVDWCDLNISTTLGEPAYYTYLHERVDGGPDRRYSYNPSAPVYHHSALILTLNDSVVNFIFENKNKAAEISKAFSKLKNILLSQGLDILLPTLTKGDNADGYASAFRLIIESHGIEVVKNKLFLSFLSDYMEFKEKPYIRQILVTINEENYWDDILGKTDIVKRVELMQNKLISFHKFPKEQVDETIGYIKYGLGVTP